MMGKLYQEIDATLAAFIAKQHLFFVASAPIGGEGHVNLSPKGFDAFAILDPMTVAYLDLTGSGVETIAHLQENGRIVIMFCAFEGPPKILRLYGRGEVVTPHDPPFTELRAHFPPYLGVRAVIRVRLERITDSCGFGVPVMHYESERTQLHDWAAHKGEEALLAYREANNSNSIDGLPGLASLTSIPADR